MPIPKKKTLPSLDNLLPPLEDEFIIEESSEEEKITQEENTIFLGDMIEDGDEDVQELTDDDFEEEIPELEIPEPPKEDKKPIKLKKDNIKVPKVNLPKLSVPNLKGINLKVPNLNKFLKKPNDLKFNPKLIIGTVVGVILILFVLKMLFSMTSGSPSSIKYNFIKEDYSGLVYEVNSKEDKTINVQALVEDKETNELIFCETGYIEVNKDKKTEVFADCLNYIDKLDMSNKKIVKQILVTKNNIK